MKLKTSKVFWGGTPRPPWLLLHLGGAAYYLGPGTRLLTGKRSVPTLCPGIGCVLATPLMPDRRVSYIVQSKGKSEEQLTSLDARDINYKGILVTAILC